MAWTINYIMCILPRNFAKEIWESSEKNNTRKLFNTKMFVVESKMVIIHVQELHVLLHDIYTEYMFLSETFQVAGIIEKLPFM